MEARSVTHTRISTTMDLYTHVMPAVQRQTPERMNDLRSGGRPVKATGDDRRWGLWQGVRGMTYRKTFRTVTSAALGGIRTSNLSSDATFETRSAERNPHGRAPLRTPSGYICS